MSGAGWKSPQMTRAVSAKKILHKVEESKDKLIAQGKTGSRKDKLDFRGQI